MLIGGDYSKWDGILNWSEHDWDFAFVKASEGTVKDIRFEEQWKTARGHVLRGAYHFFRSFVDPIVAANTFVDYLGNDRGELPPVLDLELADGRPDVPQRALIWLRECRKRINRTPIVYTSEGFANFIHLENFPEIAEYPLWLAQYRWDKITATWSELQRENKIHDLIRSPETYTYPVTIRPFKGQPRFAQWTAKAKPEFVPGYPLGEKLAVDVNFYPGTIVDLFKEFNITYDPIGDTMTDTRPITMTAELREFQPSNLRNLPGLTGTSVRRTMTGPLIVQGVGQKQPKDGYWWIEIVLPFPGWIALTTAYDKVIWLTPIDPAKQIVKIVTHFSDGTTFETFPR